MQTRLRKLIQEMDRKARKLDNIVAENQNTKREIKDSSNAIRYLMSQMTTKDMLDFCGDEAYVKKS